MGGISTEIKDGIETAGGARINGPDDFAWHRDPNNAPQEEWDCNGEKTKLVKSERPWTVNLTIGDLDGGPPFAESAEPTLESMFAEKTVAFVDRDCVPIFDPVGNLTAIKYGPFFYMRTGVPLPKKPDEPGHPEFLKILDEMRALHQKKAADYGTDEDCFANVKASAAFGIPAWVGVMIRAQDKVQRIKSFIAKGSLANESLEDSLIDLAAYSVIALALVREDKVREQQEAKQETEANTAKLQIKQMTQTEYEAYLRDIGRKAKLGTL